MGLLLYAVSMLLWLNALSKVELSQVYPFVGMGFVLTTLAGWALFGDSLSPERNSPCRRWDCARRAHLTARDYRR